MTFDETLEQVLGLLQREKRLSYRALKRRFGLDDDYLADLKDEIIEAKQLGVDENGKVLVWSDAGDASGYTHQVHVQAPAHNRPMQQTADFAERPPAAYTPRHLLETVLASRNALEGTQRQITVLVCDIADSAELARQLNPALMRRLTGDVLELGSEAVHRYRGIVSEYLGDGLMALFGAPLALQEHAYCALRAALAMRDMIDGYSATMEREYGPGIRLRFGIDSGQIAIEHIADNLRMRYSAADSHPAHLAAKLQMLAEPGTLLLSETTHHLVGDYIDSEAVGLAAKNDPAPLTVRKVTGLRRRQEQPHNDTAADPPPLTGRRYELNILRENLALALDKQIRVIDITADAGAGKSRLLAELRHGLGDSVLWLDGEGREHSRYTPLQPWRTLLSRWFHIESGDHPLQIARKLHRELARIDSELLPLIAFFEAIFDLPETGAQLTQLSAREKRRGIFSALHRLISIAGRERPVVAVFEDLQWIDDLSQECLSEMVDHAGKPGLLIVTTHRPDYIAPWRKHRLCTTLLLKPLDQQTSENLASALLEEPASPQLLQRIGKQAGGNPLFIEQLIEAYQQQGLPRVQEQSQEYDRYRHDAGVDLWLADLPVTLPALLQRRIEQLAEPAKRIVRAAAVIGCEFELTLLQRICPAAGGPVAGADISEIQSALTLLQQLGLICPNNTDPEPHPFALAVFRFRHELIRDAAYYSLPARQRARLHEAIAQVLEETAVEARTPEDTVILAHHYRCADSPAKAAFYALLAGDRASRYLPGREAAACYQQALELARTLADHEDARQLQIDACLKLAEAAADTSRTEHDLHNLEHVCTLAADLQDKQRLARALYQLGRLHLTQGDCPAALKFAERSLAIADQLGDETLATPAVKLAGQLVWLQSDYQRTIQVLLRSAGQLNAAENSTGEAVASAYNGWACAFLGNSVKALDHIEHSLQLIRGQSNPSLEATICLCRGAVYDQRGDWERALAEYSAAKRLAEQSDDAFCLYLSGCQQGRALVMSGDVKQGRSVLQECMAFAAKFDIALLPAWPRAHLADALVKLQQYDEAQQLCRDTLRLALAGADHYGQFMLQRTLAEALACSQPQQSAAVHAAMQEAIRLQRQLEARPELARSYFCYARLLRRLDEYEDAGEYRAQAIALFEQLDMQEDLAALLQQLPSDQLIS